MESKKNEERKFGTQGIRRHHPWHRAMQGAPVASPKTFVEAGFDPDPSGVTSIIREHASKIEGLIPHVIQSPADAAALRELLQTEAEHDRLISGHRENPLVAKMAEGAGDIYLARVERDQQLLSRLKPGDPTFDMVSQDLGLNEALRDQLLQGESGHKPSPSQPRRFAYLAEQEAEQERILLAAPLADVNQALQEVSHHQSQVTNYPGYVNGWQALRYAERYYDHLVAGQMEGSPAKPPADQSEIIYRERLKLDQARVASLEQYGAGNRAYQDALDKMAMDRALLENQIFERGGQVTPF